jgi:hypothetical protein
MAMASVKWDALAVLVVRLQSDQPREGALCWHSWEKSSGAHPHGLPDNIERRSIWDAPFKGLPRPGSWHYFNQHVESLLFPSAGGRGARWICCPQGLYLEFRTEEGGPARRAGVDLLERITTPLEPKQTYGLIHLSLLPTEEEGAPDTLQWGKGVSTTFRRVYEKFELDLTDGGRRTKVADGRPVRALVSELFGDPDDSLERSFYTVYMAQCPPGLLSDEDEEGQKEWRRALAQRRPEMRPLSRDGGDEDRDARQTLRISARVSALVMGRGTAFSLEEPITGSYARNFRSYWAESIVYGLLQQYSLEEFQQRLADFGAHIDPRIGRLREAWLKFRNVLWWSQLSASSEIPQELIARLRNEQGTERLFSDLEGDLATYSEYQHQDALANLQIYGSAIVAFGPLATVIGLLGASGRLLGILLGAAALFALVVFLTVRIQIKGWPAFVQRWRGALAQRWTAALAQRWRDRGT